jgi:hypothetical protein
MSGHAGRRVGSFGLFNDTSEMDFLGRRISLNVAATACKSHAKSSIQVSLGSIKPL